ncbi:657ba005-fde2-4794-a774-89cfe5b9c3f3 [Sclerotinia trifoliorum]|uniref:657ba005-fde2-4794-a774-89cfe5b9c3f3 n=1 Tax=Sclerotinia trifoliorum TaxID=28548 RepID=A0A8H2VYI7_9HELO|nr:657ba005-fde2-4794-a774-89cfe5b9c3f3 [Sclerotinia trifoliorum]
MEALLSLSFDNLSSYDASKIRKGLRQVEGLLAQICLSNSSKSNVDKRRSVIDPGKEPPPRKPLNELPNDAAFREFFRLQEGFEWNVAMRLVTCLDRLMGKSNDGQSDMLIIQTLELIQGVLLLHPPSRSLFSRELYMNHLLDLLEPVNCPAIQSATLLTLVCSLIETPKNTRTFETLDGLLTITSIFKSRETSREVKLKLVEFLYFYLMPETPSIPSAAASNSLALLQRSPSKLPGAFNNREEAGRRRAQSESEQTKTLEEKQELLGRYLHNVDDLVADLRESHPFGGTVGS